jgi:hypothetical protein
VSRLKEEEFLAMDGPARDPRFGLVQRSYAPTRLSDDTLTSVYDRVVQARMVVDEVSEAPGVDVPASESSLLVLTGGRHA